MFCTCCKKELPENEFFPNLKKGGYYPVCRNCRRTIYYQSGAWRKKNSEYVYFETPTDPLTLNIVNKACELFNVGIRDFYSDCRMQAMAYARAYACQLIRDNTSFSTLQIGAMVHLDHTCVLRNCRPEMRDKVKIFLNKSLEGATSYKKVCNYKTGEIMYIKK